MIDERLNLSPLDPSTDNARFERSVKRVLANAAGVIAARRARGSAIGLLLWWERSVLIAAAAVAIAALGLSMARREIGKPSIRPGPQPENPRASSMSVALSDWIDPNEESELAALVLLGWEEP